MIMVLRLVTINRIPNLFFPSVFSFPLVSKIEQLTMPFGYLLFVLFIKELFPQEMFHTTLLPIQGVGKIELKPAEWGIKGLSFSGHKIYAPKGIGCLYLQQGFHIHPLIHGGGQEFGLREGIENICSIITMGEAVKLAEKEQKREWIRMIQLR